MIICKAIALLKIGISEIIKLNWEFQNLKLNFGITENYQIKLTSPDCGC